jgi:hypothetical protein
MAFVKINQWELSVSSAAQTLAHIGQRERAFNGTMLATQISQKREWTLTTPWMDPTEAEKVRLLLLGLGDKWDFSESTGNDWQWSSKGLGKASGSGSSLASGKFGRGVRIAAAGQVTWTLGTSYPWSLTTWSLMVWYYESAAWHHYILCSDGTKYKDGAVYVGSLAFLAFSGGTLTLGDSGSGGNQDFDDLVALPFVVTTGMAAAWGVATESFGPLPALKLDGTLVKDASPVQVQAEPGSIELAYEQGVLSGSFGPINQITVTLQEV